ncbi:cellulase family glycosylhydrolase [Actinomadura latina]|uniref:Cellulase family glycosylhydrolase n=1 Tax=Actinomadura latina TaxID=163603 RepID=A0A846Z088_9ACTN|nr:cellulase family glycosylhydrolase [Actinomadura latina]NKZ05347.1 cellulase family glycosylhydrolase [Actinomadura latina]
MPPSTPHDRTAINRRQFIGVTAGAAAASTLLDPAPARAEAHAQHRRRRRVRFGVNYVPSKNWWFSWSDWDRRSIAADLDDIASLGMDHIRIMLIWSELQPNATYVRGELLDRLEELLDLADRRDLDVEVTVLNGAVSGVLFVPPYLISNGNGEIRNILTDPMAIEREQWLLTQVAERIGRHRRFLGFDLSNEIHWFAIPLGMQATQAEGDAWHTALFDTCEKTAPGKIHVSGIDHWPWQNNAYWTRQGLATSGTMTANHTWAGWTQVIQRYGSLSTSSTHYSEFFIELIKAFHTDLERKVWIEETGVSTVWMDAADIPPWTERSIRAMASCTDLFGITWWDSHDLNPKLSGYVDLEYDLGLFTNDRKLKPIGKTIRELIAEFGRHPPEPLRRTTALVLPDDMIPVKDFSDLFDPFMKLIDEGTRPAVVLQSRTADAAYLAARGIKNLITLA